MVMTAATIGREDAGSFTAKVFRGSGVAKVFKRNYHGAHQTKSTDEDLSLGPAK